MQIKSETVGGSARFDIAKMPTNTTAFLHSSHEKRLVVVRAMQKRHTPLLNLLLFFLKNFFFLKCSRQRFLQ